VVKFWARFVFFFLGLCIFQFTKSNIYFMIRKNFYKGLNKGRAIVGNCLFQLKKLKPLENFKGWWSGSSGRVPA
jgi:hypothetical protein